MRTPRRLLITACTLLALGGPCVLGATNQSDSSKYVTRKEYDKLAQRLDAVTRRLNRLQKKTASKKDTQQNLEFINQELQSIKKITLAQKPGTTHFTVVGDASLVYQNKAGSNNSFDFGFSPLFLWQLNKRLLVEAGMDIGVNDAGDGFNYDLGTANISYLINDHLTLGAGLFPTPFGIFHNHLDPAWIYKLPDAPLPWQDGGIAPDRTLGLFLNGAFSAGKDSMFTYDFYAGNGPTLNTSSADAGTLNFSNFADTNSAKTVGGRVSFLPIPAIEVGYSFNVGRVNPSGSGVNNTTALLQGFDVTFKKDIPQISGTIDFRAEWLWSHVGNATYPDAGLTYANNSSGGYVQLAYRPTDLNNKILKSLELVGRYDTLQQPSQQPGFVKENRYTLGLNYWLNPSTVIESAYEWYTDTHGAAKQDGVVISYGIGF